MLSFASLYKIPVYSTILSSKINYYALSLAQDKTDTKTFTVPFTTQVYR